jgi:hypothetical protein
MGLDISHGSASWSYSGFGRFRESIATHEGILLAAMDGYQIGGTPWTSVTSPLAPLLNHSDCDGDLSPEECATIAPALREVVRGTFEEGSYDYRAGLELAASMERAAAGERLEFH